MKTGIIIILLFSIFLIVGIIGYLYISKVNKEPQPDNSKNIDIPYKEPQKKDAECSIPNGTTQEGIIEGNVDSNYIFEVMKLGKDIKNNLPDIISQFIKSNEKFVFSSSIVPTINSLENDSYYVLGTLDSSKQVRTISPQVNGGSNCLEFPSTVYKLIPPCPAGETRDSNGKCQCNLGTSRHTNNICYPPCPAGETRDPSGVCQCTAGTTRHTNNICYPPCTTGETRDSNGICQCNAGTSRHTNSKCYPPCPAGETRDPSGVCQCPAGTTRNTNGICYPPCPITGQIRHTNGVCYPPCPAGETRDSNGVCQCNAGTVRSTDGKCYTPCPEGQTRNANGICYNPCGDYGSLYNGTCLCDLGYTFNGNTCVFTGCPPYYGMYYDYNTGRCTFSFEEFY